MNMRPPGAPKKILPEYPGRIFLYQKYQNKGVVFKKGSVFKSPDIRLFQTAPASHRPALLSHRTAAAPAF